MSRHNTKGFDIFTAHYRHGDEAEKDHIEVYASSKREAILQAQKQLFVLYGNSYLLLDVSQAKE